LKTPVAIGSLQQAFFSHPERKAMGLFQVKFRLFSGKAVEIM